tara:strand:- start:2261 stop:2470 length:210 start_codon:yes stop_codon:yes gene_type:complete
MTEHEREEFIFDLALHMLNKTSKAGIFAHAVDRICDLLDKNTDEQLIHMAPDNLIIRKKKRKKGKAKGF